MFVIEGDNGSGFVLSSKNFHHSPEGVKARAKKVALFAEKAGAASAAVWRLGGRVGQHYVLLSGFAEAFVKVVSGAELGCGATSKQRTRSRGCCTGRPLSTSKAHDTPNHAYNFACETTALKQSPASSVSMASLYLSTPSKRCVM